MSSDIHIFIPSYHRFDNLKSVKYLAEIGWDMSRVVVFVDDEAGDSEKYEEVAKTFGFKLEILSASENRRRFDFVHREPKSRRCAGMWRNAFCEYAEREGVREYLVMDDDTQGFEIKLQGKYQSCEVKKELLCFVIEEILGMMRTRGIGAFALPQTGDFIGGESHRLWIPKMMNCIIYQTGYIKRGERGVQDNDTSMFCGLWNEGYFCGSFGDGVVLKQALSGVSNGGLTALYHEQKLLNKALVVPIQFPSGVFGEKQPMNGGRLHHHIEYRYFAPKILKGTPDRDNINWRRWEEDRVFTNEKINQSYGE